LGNRSENFRVAPPNFREDIFSFLALPPPYLEGEPFSGIAKTKFPTFYIPRKPKDLLDIYKGDNNWKNLVDKIQLIPK